MQSNRSSQRAATLPAIASVHGSHFSMAEMVIGAGCWSTWRWARRGGEAICGVEASWWRSEYTVSSIHQPRGYLASDVFICHRGARVVVAARPLGDGVSRRQSGSATGAVGTKDAAEDVGLIVVRQKSAVLRRADLKPRLGWADRALFAALIRLLPRHLRARLVIHGTMPRWYRWQVAAVPDQGLPQRVHVRWC